MSQYYVSAIVNEWEEKKVESLDTLYFGGGTPSALPIRELSRLIDIFPTPARELTIEVNPEDIIDGKCLPVLSGKRVSMGVQSFNDHELAFIGRRHSATQAEEAVKILRAEGCDNLSLDLIYGLPGQNLDSWKRSLDVMMELKPSHLSCYLLSYEQGTRLWAMLQTGKVKEADEDLVTEMYHYLCQTARQAGYEHYEISNFALPGFQAIHNSSYWEGEDYIGLGPGAHSCVQGIRSFNPPNLKQYLEKDGRGFSVIEKETSEEKFNDFILTRLRTSRGLDLSSAPCKEYILSVAQPYLRKGMMEITAGHLRIAEKDWLVADCIISDFIII